MLTAEIPVLQRLIRSFEVTMKLNKLVEQYGEASVLGPDDVVLSGLSCDSRSTRPGDLFFAVQGTFKDGSAFISEALERGAVAVVSSRELALPGTVPLVLVEDERRAKGVLSSLFFGRPSQRLLCIGLTGTNGKTTTSWMIRSILEQNGFSTGMLGTIQHRVGSESIRATTTTPDAVDIQKYLARMVDDNHDAAVLEVSSHALVQSRAEGVQFGVGVFTNLTREHMDYHGSMEEYRRAKSILFAGLAPTATAVLNDDDPNSEEMAAVCACPVITYGLTRRADVYGEVRRLDIDGFSMIVKSPAGSVDVTSRLLGRYNVSNALAAAAAAVAMNVPLSAVKAGIEALRAVPGRVETIDVGQDFRVIVDYAHTDDALRKLLENLCRLTSGRLITVFGCGGDRDAFKRPLMAEAATSLSDLTVITSDNPRSEDAAHIIDDILKGCASGAAVKVEPDRRAAIEYAIGEARGGDIVAIAGKGHEDYQILNSGRVDFDDRKVAREALWKLSN
jgi:UDP-N-acetylmuramoyl-L-alanyl-D-glutamate--2,6-diaminopimelate ligase